MPSRPSREVARIYSSRARVDTTCVLLWASADALEARLRPLGLEVTATVGAPCGKHPIWVDLGYVRSGAGEALALNQHEWWRRTAEAAGSAWGWAAGAWTLGALRAPSQVFAGSAVRVAEQFSLGISHTLGTYEEILIGIPNVMSSRGRGPYCFVLGMYTNSPVAIWGDRALRYGYKKQHSRIDSQTFRSYSARDARGKSLLSAEITEASTPTWRPAGSVAGLTAQLPLLSQPLLCHLGGDRFALSLLERDYLEPGHAVARPSHVRLNVAPALLPELPDAAAAIVALGPEEPWGAFSVSDLPTRVTYPSHLSLADL